MIVQHNITAMNSNRMLGLAKRVSTDEKLYTKVSFRPLNDKGEVQAEFAKAALALVSQQRSDLGAVQNRLEHTINNLDNVVEYTTSAEAAIRDTAIATEMVKYANNILQQAGTSMFHRQISPTSWICPYSVNGYHPIQTKAA